MEPRLASSVPESQIKLAGIRASHRAPSLDEIIGLADSCGILDLHAAQKRVRANHIACATPTHPERATGHRLFPLLGNQTVRNAHIPTLTGIDPVGRPIQKLTSRNRDAIALIEFQQRGTACLSPLCLIMELIPREQTVR